MLCCLTYASRASRSFSLAEVQDLWLSSLRRNEIAGITGALFFGGEYFLQVIEGEEAAVETLFNRIRRDRRHRDIEIIAYNDIASRLFREWPLKLMNGSNSDKLRATFDYGHLVAADIANRQKAVFRLSKL